MSWVGFSYLAVDLVADDVELVAVHEDRVDAVHLQKKRTNEARIPVHAQDSETLCVPRAGS